MGMALAFVRALCRVGNPFDRWHTQEYVKPAIGGLLVALIGFEFRKILGVGYGPQPVSPGCA
jgi:H+/Cl- antiporter ClcA